jgi:hypothetical protein
MRKLFFSSLLLIMTGMIASLFTSCKMAPKQDPGDTVAASVFAPIDTAALHRKQRAEQARLRNAKDSIGIFYIGAGSTEKKIQLISYPSQRDTLIYSKARHMKRSGSTDVGHVVRVTFYVSRGDSLVQGLEEITK